MTRVHRDALSLPMTAAHRADGVPLTLDEYRQAGGYEGLDKALSMSPDEVIENVEASGLLGRGGAGFSTGRKWSYSPPTTTIPKYVACNIDEMEPGSFKDRFLIERNPHLLIEGIAIACYATGSATAYAFFRGEYHKPAAIFSAALKEAYAAGILGPKALGSELGLEMYVHMSAGRYLCGEASAMLSAIEGRRALPRFRPPHMASAGLWARPTIVNNPETMSCVPAIVLNGHAWWLGLGRSKEGGTKIYTVAGRVKRPGAWELPMGTPMREIIEEHAGGMREGYAIKAVIPGGASSAMVPVRHLDVAMDFASMKAIGSSLGTGTMVVLDDHTSIVGALLNLQRFYAQESCGWCTPCWSGTQWVVGLLEDIQVGGGTREDIETLEHLAWVMKPEHCFCDHGPSAARVLIGGLREFRDEIIAHVGRPAGPQATAGAGSAAGLQAAAGIESAADPQTAVSDPEATS